MQPFGGFKVKLYGHCRFLWGCFRLRGGRVRAGGVGTASCGQVEQGVACGRDPLGVALVVQPVVGGRKLYAGTGLRSGGLLVCLLGPVATCACSAAAASYAASCSASAATSISPQAGRSRS